AGGTSCGGGGRASAVRQADLSSRESEEALAGRIWGYPPAALRLLRELEDFQRLQMAPSNAGREHYALLPADLLRLQSAAAPTAMSAAAAVAKAASAAAAMGELEEGRRQDTSHGSEAYFFWLEALYDFHSGRQAHQPPTASASAGAASESESLRWSSFSRLPMAATRDEVVATLCTP
ncbi:unnamed protein product, partial [Polarella glacialis]